VGAESQNTHEHLEDAVVVPGHVLLPMNCSLNAAISRLDAVCCRLNIVCWRLNAISCHLNPIFYHLNAVTSFFIFGYRRFFGGTAPKAGKLAAVRPAGMPSTADQ
jgi:hypothetical protein